MVFSGVAVPLFQVCRVFLAFPAFFGKREESILGRLIESTEKVMWHKSDEAGKKERTALLKMIKFT